MRNLLHFKQHRQRRYIAKKQIFSTRIVKNKPVLWQYSHPFYQFKNIYKKKMKSIANIKHIYVNPNEADILNNRSKYP